MRWIASVLSALVVTVSLFAAMNGMVSRVEIDPSEVAAPLPLQLTPRRAPRPEPEPVAPEQPSPRASTATALPPTFASTAPLPSALTNINLPQLSIPALATPVPGDGLNFGSLLGKLSSGRSIVEAKPARPRSRLPPEYPASAKRAGIEGYVTVSFRVAPDGSTADLEILESEPPQVFERAVVRAVERWRFAPSAAAARRTETIAFELEAGQ